MRQITPHLWFDTQAKEAAEFYTSVMPDSQVTHLTTLHDTVITNLPKYGHCHSSYRVPASSTPAWYPRSYNISTGFDVLHQVQSPPV